MLANIGRVDDALPLFRTAFTRDRRWLDLAERLVPVQLLPSDAAVMAKIRSAAP
jgi:hypothetical protein